ncbi:MAG: hypothetical protein ACUVX1_15225 [Chloroflexota bacterium]
MVELNQRLPGEHLVPTPTLEATRAITIKAPAEEVWPWLVQIGQGRGGFYSYDWPGLHLDAGPESGGWPDHQTDIQNTSLQRSWLNGVGRRHRADCLRNGA